jgi:DnaJ family protein C protein 9
MKSWEWKRSQQQTRSNQHIESRHLSIIQVRMTSLRYLLISSALTLVSDKATPDNKDAANKKFQEIAFAYAILSDERRRKRYDTTGNTSESLDLDDDDFNWTDFFREQYASVVTAEALDRIKKDYQGSDEERMDILGAYEMYKGDMDKIYEDVMCSNVLDDDERLRKIINDAIAAGEATPHKKYTQESEAKKQRRVTKAKNEEGEAMKLAEELGVKEKLFGTDSEGKKSNKGGNGEAGLAALIQQRQKGRQENFFDNLEAKYAGGKKPKRRAVDEPPEEAFQKNAAIGKKKHRANKA